MLHASGFGGDSYVRWHDSLTGAQIGEKIATPGFAVLSPDETLVATLSWQSVKLWNAETREFIREFGATPGGHENTIVYGRFSPNNEYLATAGGQDHKLIVWKLSVENEEQRLHRAWTVPEDMNVQTVEWSPAASDAGGSSKSFSSLRSLRPRVKR